jgi:hypothetical protein
MPWTVICHAVGGTQAEWRMGYTLGRARLPNGQRHLTKPLALVHSDAALDLNACRAVGLWCRRSPMSRSSRNGRVHCWHNPLHLVHTIDRGSARVSACRHHSEIGHQLLWSKSKVVREPRPTKFVATTRRLVSGLSPGSPPAPLDPRACSGLRFPGLRRRPGSLDGGSCLIWS